jgi:hypothetical protein
VRPDLGVRSAKWVLGKREALVLTPPLFGCTVGDSFPVVPLTHEKGPLVCIITLLACATSSALGHGAAPTPLTDSDDVVLGEPPNGRGDPVCDDWLRMRIRHCPPISSNKSTLTWMQRRT